MTKVEQALIVSEKVLDGIENENISTSSALLQCLRIARLLEDVDAIIWLQYEYGGYPRVDKGNIDKKAFAIACNNGRGYIEEEKELVFLELASELESRIISFQNAINNFSTQGVSVSGTDSYVAIRRLTDTVQDSTSSLLKSIFISENKLAKLKGAYYDYALKKQIELSFSNVVTDIFAKYREVVDSALSGLSSQTVLKLQAIEDKINSDNPEVFSQALATCRRLFENVATELFDKYFPNYSEKTYRTKSGTDIDVSVEHYRNRLSAVIERLQNKSIGKTLVGSNILYLLDWIENLNNLQSKGVHADITKDDAMKCIIHTYVCLGDILNLQ